MELQIKRIALKENYTVGQLYIDGIYFCDTLENPVRDLTKEKKVPGETAIPAGCYKVRMNRSIRFKRVLPLLVDVPHFSGIYIHRGNTVKDTAGCILVGENKKVGMVLNSTVHEKMLVNMLQDEADITILITN